MQLCKNRTVIVTGAGAGLGRAYALALAQAGANVVVNDIRKEAAEAVAEEIRKAGGHAHPDTGDITTMQGAEAIVAAAVATYGEVHALVNNAGICRDRMFASMGEADWDEVMRVHLKGHFCLANVLARRWRDAAKAGRPVAGRIINTSSGAGLAGSVGQSNYAAAKAGIAALTLVQAAELSRYGVTANCLAPAARTGMTADVFAAMMKAPDDGFDYYDPANVAPVVVWLASEESAQVTGRTLEVAGGRIALAEGWQPGPARDKGERWLPHEVGDVVTQLVAQGRAAQPVYGA